MSTSPFTEALQAEVATLQAQHPILAGALDKALTLVAGGAVFPLEDGRTAHVRSQSDPTRSHLVNGTCDCKAAQHHAAPCAHRLAFRVYQRVIERLAADEERWVPVDLPEAPPVPLEPSGASDPRLGQPAAAAAIPAHYLVSLHGKPFVRYVGLLAMAHEAGLVTLTTQIESHTAALVLASATATFQDGRSFTEWGDATPENVGPQVRPHWMRMALTRAKARCLRDALNVGMVALEELGEES